MNKKEFREWVNTFVGVGGLIVLIIGFVFGISEINQINIKLDNIKAQSIETQSLTTPIIYAGDNFTIIDKNNNTYFFENNTLHVSKILFGNSTCSIRITNMGIESTCPPK